MSLRLRHSQVALCRVAQYLRPAALARAIRSQEAGSGRSRLRQVRRWWHGPALPLKTITYRVSRCIDRPDVSYHGGALWLE